MTDPEPNQSSRDTDPASQSNFLHPITMLLDIFSGIRQLIIPVFVGGFAFRSRWFSFTYLLIGLFALGLIRSVVKYLSFRYEIRGRELVVDEGIIFRKHRTVPVQRIQNVDFQQNLIQRLFKVAEVRIETASGTEPEAVLKVLSLEKVELLRRSIFAIRKAVQDSERSQLNAQSESHAAAILDPALQANETAQIPGHASPLTELERDNGGATLSDGFDATDTDFETRERIHRITVWQLIQSGLLSNRGAVFVGVLIGLYFNTFGQGDWDSRRIPREAFQRLGAVSEYFGEMPPYLVIPVGAVVVLVLLKMLSVGWYILRFAGYTLDRSGEDLQVRCGLLTQVSATVPRPRIQFISIHRGLGQRMLGLASIRIETAGGTKNAEDATASVGRRWFVPVVPEQHVQRLMNELRVGLNWNEENVSWKPLAPKAKTRLLRFEILLALVATAAIAFAAGPWYAFLGLLLIPMGIWHALKRARAMRYARDEQTVMFRSGVFTRKCSVTFIDKIQALAVKQSPFDRRWKMASLCVDTAASGPADHKIEVNLLDERFAETEFASIAASSSESTIRWS